ncbi:MAG: hypothetical protein HY695_27200 [Deltaproteobacteria bacterium]|nr:hypothetical protein [Deltaproteobacteria bacterium]
MIQPSFQDPAERPERIITQVITRLKTHALRDLLLMALPPLAALFYVGFFLHRAAWLSLEFFALTSLAMAGSLLVAGLLRFRFSAASRSLAARLVDQKAAAKDRFLTLATIDPSKAPSFFVERLRQEAATLVKRIHFKKEFPYRIKRSFFVSIVVSVCIILLFHLLWSIAYRSSTPARPSEDLRLLARKIEQAAVFPDLARKLESAAVKLQDENISEAEKQALIQELIKNLEQQLAAGSAGDARDDLLRQVRDALQGLERDFQKGSAQKGAGGIKSNLPDHREGQGTGSEKGEGGEAKHSQLQDSKNQELRGEKSGKEKEPEPGKKQNEGRGDRNQGTERRPEQAKQEKEEKGSKEKAESGSKGFKRQDEEIPQGPPPERFHKAGAEGKQGVKAARYVVVQLPDEFEAAAGEGVSGKGKRVRAKTPASNAPLRSPDTPGAAGEKQLLPLEYRGLIR